MTNSHENLYRQMLQSIREDVIAEMEAKAAEEAAAAHDPHKLTCAPDGYEHLVLTVPVGDDVVDSYARYQLAWMLEHGCTLPEYVDAIVTRMHSELSDKYGYLKLDEMLDAMRNAQEGFELDEGFDGEVYASFDEWYRADWSDAPTPEKVDEYDAEHLDMGGGMTVQQFFDENSRSTDVDTGAGPAGNLASYRKEEPQPASEPEDGDGTAETAASEADPELEPEDEPEPETEVETEPEQEPGQDDDEPNDDGDAEKGEDTQPESEHPSEDGETETADEPEPENEPDANDEATADAGEAETLSDDDGDAPTPTSALAFDDEDVDDQSEDDTTDAEDADEDDGDVDETTEHEPVRPASETVALNTPTMSYEPARTVPNPSIEDDKKFVQHLVDVGTKTLRENNEPDIPVSYSSPSQRGGRK